MNKREELRQKIQQLESELVAIENSIRREESDVAEYERQLEVLRNEYMDDVYATENEYIRETAAGSSWDEIGAESQERREEHQQTKYDYEEKKRIPEANLREAKNKLADLLDDKRYLRRKLADYREEFNALGNGNDNIEVPDYEPYVDEDYEEFPSDDYEEESYDYAPTNVPPQRTHTKPVSNVKPIVRPNKEIDIYSRKKTALKNYAVSSGKKYKELVAFNNGYRASVGDTVFDYKDKDDLVISSAKGVPSIEDFQAIFAAERAEGRMSLSIGGIKNKEYQARMIVGASEAGLSVGGDIRLSKQDVEKLEPNTQDKYNKFIQKFDEVRRQRLAALAKSNNKSK